jgi:hypothetical protein
MKSLSGKLEVILFIIGLSIFGNIEAWGADWRLYNDVGGMFASYDTHSMVRQRDGSIRVWEKWVFKETRKSQDEVWDEWLEIGKAKGEEEAKWFLTTNVTQEILFLREIRCSDRSFRNKAIVERDRKGMTLIGGLSKVDPEKVEYIQPDVSIELLFKAICR